VFSTLYLDGLDYSRAVLRHKDFLALGDWVHPLQLQASQVSTLNAHAKCLSYVFHRPASPAISVVFSTLYLDGLDYSRAVLRLARLTVVESSSSSFRAHGKIWSLTTSGENEKNFLLGVNEIVVIKGLAYRLPVALSFLLS
jgi:hypothetical protein